MGVAVSGWPLARAVSLAGQVGVVSGTALGVIFARRLETGDPGGHMRRALAHFPVPAVVDRILARHFGANGTATGPGRAVQMPTLTPSPEFTELTVAANFAEVYLAREGHDGLVGINYLEKLQLPTLPSLFGAMLAGVHVVLMGAGVPLAIPAILDGLAAEHPVSLRIRVSGEKEGEESSTHFDPRAFLDGARASHPRPLFLPIISSAALAMTLCRRAGGAVDGFVVEGPTAGGHNAPPRGAPQFSGRGEPVYGERDLPELAKIRALERPFWLAGGYAEPERLTEALRLGAAGVQVGTAFAFCRESGLCEALRRQVIAMSRQGTVDVFTDPAASPTGFPFKVLRLPGTVSEADLFEKRVRVCDLGYLREIYRGPDGSTGYRCPAEPVEAYTAKGGNAADTVGRKCLCNALPAAVGLGLLRHGQREKAIVTAGEDAARVARFLQPGADSYSAADVIRYLLGEPATPAPENDLGNPHP
ncbi:MAG: nitronate monooxygenase [Lentisphaeria bacterium]|nr:nitronate monooxygenase [Lentisphaeria bacterium]